MSALAAFQSRFADALSDPDEMGAGLFAPSPTPVSATLAVYRNNVFHSLTSALGDAYPVVAMLTGANFFAHAARHFLERRFPDTRTLVLFGEGFADFLSDFPSAASLPYLPDVARLERARLEAWHEADAPRLDSKTLDTGVALYERKLRAQPCARLLTLAWPGDTIWEAHQGADVPEMDIAPASCHLLVLRQGDHVVHMRLSPAAYIFAQSVIAGDTLGGAAHKVHASEPTCDFERILRTLISSGFFATDNPA